MTIIFTNGSTGLFDLLGKLFNLLTVANNFMGDSGTIAPDFDEVGTAYESVNLRKLITNLTSNANTFYSAAPSLSGQIFQTAQQTIIEIINQDNPQPDTSLKTALIELINQLRANAQTVKKSHLTSSFTPYTWNNGNGQVIISQKYIDGTDSEYMFGEHLVITCQSDSQTGFRTAGNESFSIQGQYSTAGATSFDYPMGSQAGQTINCIMGSGNSGYGNMLNNSAFQQFTLTNIPDHWSVSGGFISQDSSTSYIGSNSLKIMSDGLTSAAITQYFNDPAYTNLSLLPDTQYSVCLWSKLSSIPGTGILNVRLCDGNGATLTDRRSNSNSFSVNLNAGSTSWFTATGCFRTGRILPDTIGLEIKIDPPPQVGTILNIDNVGYGLMTEVYSGGPWISVHSGSGVYINQDGGIINIANDRAGKMGEWVDRSCSLKSYDFMLPSSDTPSIPDSLII